jgi:Tol biopolymer transport system component
MNKQSQTLIFLFVILVVIIFFGLAYTFLNVQPVGMSNQNVSPSPIHTSDTATETPQIAEDLFGKVYFSFGTENTRVANIQYLDLRSNLVFDAIPANAAEGRFGPQLSPDGRFLAYVAAPVDTDTELYIPHTEPLQVYVYDFSNKTTQQITKGGDTLRNRGIRWSPDGRYLLFHGYKAEAFNSGLDLRSADRWQVMLYDFSTGKLSVMSDGFQNEWTPDGKSFYFFKDDGLYLMDLSSRKATQLIPVVNPAGRASVNNGMALRISPDGQFLVWSSSGIGNLTIYRISQSYSNPPTVYRQIDYPSGSTLAFPTFSPDSRYLILREHELRSRIQEATTSESNILLDDQALPVNNPRFVAYDLTTFAKKNILDLSGADFNVTAVTQWVY